MTVKTGPAKTGPAGPLAKAMEGAIYLKNPSLYKHGTCTVGEQGLEFIKHVQVW